MPVLDGRGHVELSAEHFTTPPVSTTSWVVNTAGMSIPPRARARSPIPITWSKIPDSPILAGSASSRTAFLPTEYLAAQITRYVHFNMAHRLEPRASKAAAMERSTTQHSKPSCVLYQAYARFDYALTDDIDFYLHGTATRSCHNSFSKEENVINNLTISSQNAFLPAQYHTALAAAGQNTFTFAKQMTETPRLTPTAWIDNYYIGGGFNGRIGTSGNWDFAYSHSETFQRVATRNNMSLGRLYASLDAVTGPNGDTVCNVTPTNPTLYPGCVPFNPFIENTITQECKITFHGRYLFSSEQFDG